MQYTHRRGREIIYFTGDWLLKPVFFTGELCGVDLAGALRQFLFSSTTINAYINLLIGGAEGVYFLNKTIFKFTYYNNAFFFCRWVLSIIKQII